jgi:hypothetical protein
MGEARRRQMDDIAIGRKEILKALHIGSWRTVRDKKKKYPGFRKLIRVDPASGRPVLIISEYKEYIIAFNEPQAHNITTP